MIKGNATDIIIVGGGPAGLTAGIYLSRGGISTLMFEKSGPGGQMAFAELIENYPGFPGGISGLELSSRMKQQAESFNIKIKLEEIKGISGGKGSFIVESDGGTYSCLGVIMAVGCIPSRLNVPGEDAYIGKGLSYCALCDGPFFAGKEVAVVGGGNTALNEAITLSKVASRIKLIHRRGTLRAVKSLQERFFNLGNAEFIGNSVVTGITGNDRLQSIRIKNLETGAEQEIEADGVFVAVGYTPNTGFLKDIIELDEQGLIITDEQSRTAVEGIFACGDAVKGNLKQVVAACGSGAVAANSAMHYAEKLKGTFYG